MTEADWLACDHPQRMLEFVRGRVSERKLRLFACACCRRAWHLLADERSRQAVEFAERLGEWPDRPVDDEWRAIRYEAGRAACELSFRDPRTGGDVPTSPSDPRSWEVWVYIRAAKAADLAISEGAGSAAVKAPEWAATAMGIERSGPVGPGRTEPGGIEPFLQAERGQQAGSFRDIFGNPFRPVTFCPEWRTETAVSLARTMYDARDFSAMPILADALQDAGCDNEEILNHCRGPGPHVRGCWVCDLVLGKE